MADIKKLEMGTGTCLYSQSSENEVRDLSKVQRQPGLHQPDGSRLYRKDLSPNKQHPQW